MTTIRTNESLARGLSKRATRAVDEKMQSLVNSKAKLKPSIAARPRQRVRKNTQTIRRFFGAYYVGHVDIDIEDKKLRAFFVWDSTAMFEVGGPRLMLGTVALSRASGHFMSQCLGRLVISQHAAQRVIQRRCSLDWREPLRELGDALVTGWLVSSLIWRADEENRLRFAVETTNGSALIVVELPEVLVTVVSWLPREQLRQDQLIELARYDVSDTADLVSGRTEVAIYKSWDGVS